MFCEEVAKQSAGRATGQRQVDEGYLLQAVVEMDAQPSGKLARRCLGRGTHHLLAAQTRKLRRH